MLRGQQTETVQLTLGSMISCASNDSRSSSDMTAEIGSIVSPMPSSTAFLITVRELVSATKLAMRYPAVFAHSSIRARTLCCISERINGELNAVASVTAFELDAPLCPGLEI